MPDSSTRFFERYTALVPETDLVAVLRDQLGEAWQKFSSVTDARANRVDPPYTWTIKQVIQHSIDTERVFGYRALRFARADTARLPGFDENAYARAVDVAGRTLENLFEEWMALRSSHVAMFQHIDRSAWTRTGIAGDLEWSVDDLARSIAGHARHHLRIIDERLSR